MRSRILFVWLLGCGCVIDVKDYHGQACDPVHACPADLICFNGSCLTAAEADGGTGGGGGGGATATGGGSALGGGASTGGGSATGGGGSAVGGGGGGSGGGSGGGDGGCHACPLQDGVCAGTMDCGSGCTYPTTFELNGELTCGDGLDNDCDGFVDDKSGCLLTLSGAEGSYGGRDGPSANARFATPNFLARSPDGGSIYVADTFNHAIRALELAAGTVRTLVGTGRCGGANGPDASTCQPTGVAAAPDGTIYFTDLNRVRAIQPDGGVVTIAGVAGSGYVDGAGPAVRFNNPSGIAILANGDLLVVDTGNARIRRVTPLGNVTTEAGGGDAGYDGPRTNMNFNTPRDLLVASDGTWYVTESHLVRKVPATGTSFALAGSATAGNASGTGAVAQFNNPRQLGLDEALGRLYVTDDINASVRIVTVDAGVVSSLWPATSASSNIGFRDGPFGTAKADHPIGLVPLSSNELVFSDLDGVRSIDLGVGDVTTLAGLPPANASIDGDPATATLRSIYALAVLPDESIAFIQGDTNQVRVLGTNGVVTSVNSSITAGATNGAFAVSQFNTPRDLALTPTGELLVDDALNHCIRLVDFDAGVVSTFTGNCGGTAGHVNGPLDAGVFGSIKGIATGRHGGADVLWVDDRDNGLIRMINFSTGQISDFAGVPGQTTGLNGDAGIGTLGVNDTYLVDDADGGVFVGSGNTLRHVDATGTFTTYAPVGGTISGMTRLGSKVFLVAARQVSVFDVATPQTVTPLFGAGNGSGYAVGWHDGDAVDGGALGFGGVQATNNYVLVGDYFRIRRIWR